MFFDLLRWGRCTDRAPVDLVDAARQGSYTGGAALDRRDGQRVGPRAGEEPQHWSLCPALTAAAKTGKGGASRSLMEALHSKDALRRRARTRRAVDNGRVGQALVYAARHGYNEIVQDLLSVCLAGQHVQDDTSVSKAVFEAAEHCHFEM